MSFRLLQSDIPVNEVSASFDDSSFTAGSPFQWFNAFAIQLRAARAAGIPCAGRVVLSIDVFTRMVGEENLPYAEPGNRPYLATTAGPSYDGMEIYIDPNSPADTVRIE